MSSDETDTRTRILEATWRLMEEKRGRGVRMADVAEAAGLSRQAVYLHFGNRAELMVATLRHGDEVRGIEQRLARYRAATSGIDRLDEFVDFWAGHVPTVYGIAAALMAERDTDEAVAAAWDDRMGAVRDACRDIVGRLHADGMLSPGLNRPEAADLLYTLVSIRNWESLVIECGWSKTRYATAMKRLLRSALVADDGGTVRPTGRSAGRP